MESTTRPLERLHPLVRRGKIPAPTCRLHHQVRLIVRDLVQERLQVHLSVELSFLVEYDFLFTLDQFLNVVAVDMASLDSLRFRLVRQVGVDVADIDLNSSLVVLDSDILAVEVLISRCVNIDYSLNGACNVLFRLGLNNLFLVKKGLEVAISLDHAGDIQLSLENNLATFEKFSISDLG